MDETVPKPEIVAGKQSSGATLSELRTLLTRAKETSYTWTIATDAIEWDENVCEVLDIPSPDAVATATGFQTFMVPEHLTRWRNAIRCSDQIADSARGSPYRIHVRFLPGGQGSRTAIWLEDRGLWWPGDDGKPAVARGSIRVVDERYLEDQRLNARTQPGDIDGEVTRVHLTEALGAVMSRAVHLRQSSGFMIAAIDNLADINKAHGFDTGDEVISAVGRLLRGKLRGGDSLGRYASNKFGIIINDCNPSSMKVAANRLIEAVRTAKLKTTACDVEATISVGGVILPDHATTVAEAMSNALVALEQNATGKSASSIFSAYDPSRPADALAAQNDIVAESIVRALEENRMRFVLQPIIDAVTGEVAHYECLLRMVRQNGSLVSAHEFIVIAEKLGLARMIDHHTLGLAMALLKRRPELKLALNISSLTTNDHDWIVSLHRLSEGRRDVLQRLMIEITETAMIEDLDSTAAFVDTLRELGCCVAIDDFGSGHTSFLQLRALKINILKIDGAFVKDITTSVQSQALVRSMVEVARAFNLKTVAEWVGDAEAATLLRAMGVNYLQGFHYGQPLSPDDLKAPG